MFRNSWIFKALDSRADAASEPAAAAYDRLREYLQTAEYHNRRHPAHGVENQRMQAWIDTAGFGLPE